MLQDRIIGAFTFRKGVYEEVEKDTSFTQTAWVLVVVIAFLAQLGSRSWLVQTAGRGFGSYVTSVIGNTIGAVVGFAVAAFIISWSGRTFFEAQTDFNEMVRVLGLAYVWNVVSLLGIVGILSTTLACVISPLAVIGGILGFVAWLIAVREALDLDWTKTIGALILGLVAYIVVWAIIGLVLGALGIAAVGFTSLF